MAQVSWQALWYLLSLVTCPMSSRYLLLMSQNQVKLRDLHLMFILQYIRFRILTAITVIEFLQPWRSHYWMHHFPNPSARTPFRWSYWRLLSGTSLHWKSINWGRDGFGTSLPKRLHFNGSLLIHFVFIIWTHGFTVMNGRLQCRRFSTDVLKCIQTYHQFVWVHDIAHNWNNNFAFSHYYRTWSGIHSLS